VVFVKSRQQLRFVIADYRPLILDGVRRLLETKPNFKVLGEASNSVEALKLTRQLKPDILLLNRAMPKHPGPGSPLGDNGLEALRKLSIARSPVRVILLTGHPLQGVQIVEALWQLGARGVVSIYSARQDLLRAIKAVSAGEYWVGRESVIEAGPKRGRRLTRRELVPYFVGAGGPKAVAAATKYFKRTKKLGNTLRDAVQ
jgi:two-component system, NarL family, nitrate/nitrite response regulator NarL